MQGIAYEELNRFTDMKTCLAHAFTFQRDRFSIL